MTTQNIKDKIARIKECVKQRRENRKAMWDGLFERANTILKSLGVRHGTK